MENIVYILGAGFSAPLGLPVMSNFIVKSKDMYYNNHEKFKDFADVFNSLNRMSVIKNYYNSDLFNIEEILSILEMEYSLNKDLDFDKFRNYIAEVIKFYTPKIEKRREGLPSGNWYDWVNNMYKADDNGLFGRYGDFIAHILSIEFRKTEDSAVFSKNNNSNNYSIITLNYDMVIENYLKYLNENFSNRDKISFSNEFNELTEYHDVSKVYLSKIHGSVEPLSIIPPTWKKSIGSNQTTDWQLALRLLQDANHIRIIGYSLPSSDSYLKYLFKASVLMSKNLKKIDVICLDSDGQVKKRYDDFMEFNYYTFKNANTESYLKEIGDKLRQVQKSRDNPIVFNMLEIAHCEFMNCK